LFDSATTSDSLYVQGILVATGQITGNLTGNVTGNADTAANLADYSSNYTWSGINTFSSDVRVAGAGAVLHASSTNFDVLVVNGNATTTGYLVVGTTQPTVNMSAGDLLIGNNATTTGSHYIGGDLTVAGTTNFTGDISLSGAFSSATTTITGNLTVQDSDGTAHLFLQNNTGNLGIATTTPLGSTISRRSRN